MSTVTTTPTTATAGIAAPASASARQAAHGPAPRTREPGDRLALTALVLGGGAALGVIAWAGWLVSQIQVPI